MLEFFSRKSNESTPSKFTKLQASQQNNANFNCANAIPSTAPSQNCNNMFCGETGRILGYEMSRKRQGVISMNISLFGPSASGK